MRGGSKPGERRGGRQKGSRNKKTAATVAAIEASGMTPLDYMLAVMRDSRQPPAVRLDAAKAAAPFVHAKLESVAMQRSVDDALTKLIKRCYGTGFRPQLLPAPSDTGTGGVS